ncbi:MAG: ketol-acid reductoisomerase [Kiritimatiellia bacterium]
MAKINFGGTRERVVAPREFTLPRARATLKKETVAVLGYGVQGPAQALNMTENGIRVIVGQRAGTSSWARAKKDGWVPGKTLFSLEEAAAKGTILMLLVSDAAVKAVWPIVRPHLTPGKALYVSHGFGLVYDKLTGAKSPKGVDVFMVAPKGAGISLRRNFLSGAGVNASFAIGQDATGRATERCLACGVAIGARYLFPTTFEHEVTGDLVGERGVLLGALAGVMQAQYDVLRANGHTPSEAFHDTAEELTQSLIRLVDEKGMDWMFANCSVTAQRGALDWMPRFRQATLPTFRKLYKAVQTGREAARVMKVCGGKDYKGRLRKELNALHNSEMWRAGEAVRRLRPRRKSNHEP